MDKQTLFNTLIVLMTFVIIVCIVLVKRLERYLDSPAWNWMKASLGFFFLSQVGGLINLYAFGPGLNWLGVINTAERFAGLVCFCVSLFHKEIMYKNLFERLRLLQGQKDSRKVDKSESS